MVASLAWVKSYTPPKHERPDNTTAARMAALVGGELHARADAVLSDDLLAVLAVKHRVPADVLFDCKIELLYRLFPDQYDEPDPHAPDLPPAPRTQVERQAALDGPTEAARRATVARENGRTGLAGLLPRSGRLERVDEDMLAAFAERLLKRKPVPG